MPDDNKQIQFFTLLARFEQAYDKPLNDVQRELYWDTLGGYDLKWLVIGFRGHFGDPKRSAFFPKPGEIKAAFLASPEWEDDLRISRDRIESERSKLLEGPDPGRSPGTRRELPWDEEGITRAEWMDRRYGGQDPLDFVQTPCEVVPDAGEWTRQQALDSLKGRKAILG